MIPLPTDGRIWRYARHVQPPTGHRLLVQLHPITGLPPTTCEAYSAEISSVGPQLYHETVVLLGRVPYVMDQVLCWSFYDQADEKVMGGLSSEPPKTSPEVSELTAVWLRKFHSTDLDQVGEAVRAVGDFVSTRLREVVTPKDSVPLLFTLRVPFTPAMLPSSDSGLQDIRENVLNGLVELFTKARDR